MMGRVFQGMALAFLLVGAGLVGVAAQGKPSATPADPSAADDGASKSDVKQGGAPALQRRNPRYQVGRGDVIDLNFPLVPEFNQTLTVQPDGFITLRGAGDLKVDGQTVPELTELLRKAYSKILHDPSIAVDLKEFEKPYFIVSGEVAKPGKYDLRGDTTVTQAVAIAGGFRDGAKRTQILVFHRLSNEWTEVKKINVKEMLQARNLREDLHLEPGDMLWVPKSFAGKIDRYIPTSNVGTMVRPY